MSTAILEMPTQTTDSNDPRPAGIVSPGVDRIVLTGFMGSGKTTVGALLAEQPGWQFLDLDREIERREGQSVPQIFAERGEASFRHAEAAALASLLGQRHVVIALGGGAPEALGNRLLLEQTPRTAVVYLSAPFDVLVERCRVQAADPGATVRPVLADIVVAAARFTSRRPHYERLAAHRVETAGDSAEETVRVILAKLNASRGRTSR